MQQENPLSGVVDVSAGRTFRLFVLPEGPRQSAGIPRRRRVSGGLVNENDDEQYMALVALAKWAAASTPRRWAVLASHTGIDRTIEVVAELSSPEEIPRGELFEMDVAYRVRGEPYAPWAEAE